MNSYSLSGDIAIRDKLATITNRRERHRLLRKLDILSAAEHIFALKGYHKATLRDIARKAQYAVGTVYLYFTDKDALYLSIVEEKMKGLLAVLQNTIIQGKPARQKLEVFIYETLVFFEKNQDFFRIFISEESEWSLRKKISKSSVIEKHKEYFIELIRAAQQEGVVRSDVPARQISNVFGSLLTSVVFNWLQDAQQNKDLKNMSGTIIDMFLNGVKKR